MKYISFLMMLFAFSSISLAKNGTIYQFESVNRGKIEVKALPNKLKFSGMEGKIVELAFISQNYLSFDLIMNFNKMKEKYDDFDVVAIFHGTKEEIKSFVKEAGIENDINFPIISVNDAKSFFKMITNRSGGLTAYIPFIITISKDGSIEFLDAKQYMGELTLDKMEYYYKNSNRFLSS